MDWFAGVTAIETNAAALTAKVAEVAADTLPNEALILELIPMAASELTAKPGVVVLMVTPVKDEDHVTLDVMFCVVLFV
jgi:hypothetical protein